MVPHELQPSGSGGDAVPDHNGGRIPGQGRGENIRFIRNHIQVMSKTDINQEKHLSYSGLVAKMAKVPDFGGEARGLNPVTTWLKITNPPVNKLIALQALT